MWKPPYDINSWCFWAWIKPPGVMVDHNGGTPSHHPFHSISIGFSLKNQPFWSTPLCENPHILNRIPVFCQGQTSICWLGPASPPGRSVCSVREKFRPETSAKLGASYIYASKENNTVAVSCNQCVKVFFITPDTYSITPYWNEYISIYTPNISTHLPNIKYQPWPGLWTVSPHSTLLRPTLPSALASAIQEDGDAKSSRHMVVSQNRGTPFLDGISHYKIYKPSIFGLPQK